MCATDANWTPIFAFRLLLYDVIILCLRNWQENRASNNSDAFIGSAAFALRVTYSLRMKWARTSNRKSVIQWIFCFHIKFSSGATAKAQEKKWVRRDHSAKCFSFCPVYRLIFFGFELLSICSGTKTLLKASNILQPLQNRAKHAFRCSTNAWERSIAGRDKKAFINLFTHCAGILPHVRWCIP